MQYFFDNNVSFLWYSFIRPCGLWSIAVGMGVYSILANSYIGIPSKRKKNCLGRWPKPQLKSVERQSWGHRWDKCVCVCLCVYFLFFDPTLCSVSSVRL